MAISLGRSFGMLVLGVWLILTGLIGFGVAIPGVLMAVLAIIAGILILIGR